MVKLVVIETGNQMHLGEAGLLDLFEKTFVHDQRAAFFLRPAADL
jgi:hypothetical protein